MVHTKTDIFTHFYEQYLALFTMVSRKYYSFQSVVLVHLWPRHSEHRKSFVGWGNFYAGSKPQEPRNRIDFFKQNY